MEIPIKFDSDESPAWVLAEGGWLRLADVRFVKIEDKHPGKGPWKILAHTPEGEIYRVESNFHDINRMGEGVRMLLKMAHQARSQA